MVDCALGTLASCLLAPSGMLVPARAHARCLCNPLRRLQVLRPLHLRRVQEPARAASQRQLHRRRPHRPPPVHRPLLPLGAGSTASRRSQLCPTALSRTASSSRHSIRPPRFFIPAAACQRPPSCDPVCTSAPSLLLIPEPVLGVNPPSTTRIHTRLQSGARKRLLPRGCCSRWRHQGLEAPGPQAQLVAALQLQRRAAARPVPPTLELLIQLQRLAVHRLRLRLTRGLVRPQGRWGGAVRACGQCSAACGCGSKLAGGSCSAGGSGSQAAAGGALTPSIHA